MVTWTGKRISSLKLYSSKKTPSFLKIGYEHFVFGVFYIICLYYCYITLGEQYYEALSMYENQEINVLDDYEKLRNRAEDFLSGNLPDPSTVTSSSNANPNYVIPSKWSPGFWPSVALGVVATLHALFVLGQIWSVKFKCLVKYSPESDAFKATHVHIVPSSHQGKQMLVPIESTKDGALFFSFHRRKYLYDSATDCFQKVKCRVDYSVGHYTEWAGVNSEIMHAQLLELYGPNRFQMASPSFMDLYYEQVTSPFTMFQVFTTLLWCLDSYWQYSLFNFFMIFMFEATTVFSRQRSLGVIKNMGNEVAPVMVYRSGKWITVTTEDLVPGDLFSLIKPRPVVDEETQVTTTPSDTIPCDAILIAGGAVVNESTLTGESIPQMKDGIILSNNDSVGLQTKVNIKGVHKINTLFGGTRILQVTSVGAKKSEEDEDLHDEMEAAGGSGSALTSSTEEDDDAGLVEQLSVIQQYVAKVPAPPNDGCICYCARTGFCSSQGKLVRLIEVSQTTTVRGDTTDTILLLLFLLVFALIASGYVLHRGMEDGTRSRYQLLLHCILIVTSVIPPELPMQTALAVNNSLMTLMKMQMFCTEPFRVPMAGKVDTCVFDKTGTLTTDELVAVGIVPASTRVETLVKAFDEAMKKVTENVKKTAAAPTPVRQQMQQRKLFGLIPYGAPVPVNAAHGIPIVKDTVSVAGAGMHSMSADVNTTAAAILVLGGCHSLVLIDGKMGGDPLEEASMKAAKWELHKKVKDISRPTAQSVADKPFEVCIPASGGTGLTSKMQVDYLKILGRHHFSSKLQRMSVVVRVGTPGGVDGGLILVKGSPEMIATMCKDVPADYHDVSKNLARRGMRVIALAWRRISNEQIAPCCESRLEVEKDLTFVGFVSFMCRVRKDSASVVHQLREGGNAVAMATGDAILTGIHVAKEVGITTPSKKGILLLECVMNEDEHPKGLKWVNFDNSQEHSTPFDANTVSQLAVDYDLCTSGQAISYALDQHRNMSKYLHMFVVYARMRPDEKERVLVLMKEENRVTLMCGDGANDVGALRQAHVGIALLSGFGDLNGVKDTVDSKPKPEGIMGAISAAADAANAKQAQNPNQRKISPELEAKLNALTIQESDDDLFLKVKTSEIHRRLRLIGVEPNDYPQIVDKKDIVVLYKQSVKDKSVEYKDILRQRRLAKMTPRERQAEINRENAENMKKKQEDFQKEVERLTAAGDSWAMFTAMKTMWAKEQENAKKIREKNMKNASLQGSAGQLAQMMEGMENMEDLDQPMIKIGDASVASPFTSKMPSIRGAVDVIRQGRCTLVTTIQMYQILALNCLISAYSLSALHLDGIKYGDKQLTCMGMLMSVSFISISRSQPLDKLSDVQPLKSVFHPAYFLSILGQFALHLATMYFLVQESKKFLPEDYKPDLDGLFKQNLINSVVFLVTAVQQVSVFVVNLKGPPYMGGLGQNYPLLYSLVTTFLGVFMCASEMVPQVNKWLQLEPFPNTTFRNMVLVMLAIDVCGAYIWDRVMLGIFAYPVLKASLKATTKEEVVMIIRVILFVSAIMYYLVSSDWTEFWEEYERQQNETMYLGEMENGVDEAAGRDLGMASNSDNYFENTVGDRYSKGIFQDL